MMFPEDLRRHVDKFYGKYSGEVTENDESKHEDGDRMGRVKVKVPTIFGPKAELWARPCLPFAHYFVPAIGTKVWIEFEAGDTRYPLWVGSWYPVGKIPEKAAIDPPDNRVIQTPSGHTIELLDKEGEEKIVIKHKGNSFLSIDKEGSVIISNQKGSHIFLNSKDETATFMEQHGNLLSMTKDGVLVTNVDGSMLELKGDTVRVAATNVLLQGSSVAVGEGAQEPTILGQTFMSMWNMFIMHTHASAMGPTGTPVPPGQPLAPGNGLTAAVVVK
jgi:uncharacterized protein involved in type VI secretion and phage assembly